ncbi:MAG: response regulator transcription factor [Selenomonas ruminantium]|jgi:two-component system chemotaxis response regulator CheY|nr:response regulator transcription factor [Selenomonas ruminantium]
MKILIAEDDRLSRVFLKKFMGNYGSCDVAVDGMEALELGCDAYAAKPIDTDKVTLVLKNLGLLKE